jgi:hypothetical protein
MDANEYYLGQHLRKLAEEDRREASIEGIAKDLSSKGEEFYPYSPDNLTEAFCNADPAVIDRLGELLSSNLYMKAGITLMELAADFWWPYAIQRAEQTVQAGERGEEEL